MVKHNVPSLDGTFGALSDPTRRSILARLATGSLTMGELAQPYDMSLAAVSKHVGVLRAVGLVTQEKVGRLRRCRLNAQPLQAVAAWISTYERFWEGRLDALAEYLERTTEEDESWPQHEGQKNKRVSKSDASLTRRGKRSSRRGRTPGR